MNLRDRGKQAIDNMAQSTDRQWVIWLTGAVVLVVSLLSCVTYITLMSNAFPDGMFRIACYIGAGANLILMGTLLWGKFVWIRPNTHQSKISWLVTFVEVAIASLNLMLAYALSHGGPNTLQFPLNFWYSLAPMSPVFSMVGAIFLLMSSSDMAMRHKQIEAHEEMRLSEQELALQQHRANMSIQSTYVDYIEAAMIKRLNSQTVLETIDRNADATVARVIADMSGMSPVVIPDREQPLELPAPKEQPSTPVQPVTQSPDAVDWRSEYLAFKAETERKTAIYEQQIARQEQARPLAMPELKAEASQNGNGH